MKTKLAIAATTLIAFLTCSTVLAWDTPLNVAENTTYTLSDDETYDQLIVGGGAVIELNGHDLTITGAISPSSTSSNRATIKNSAEGDPAKMTFTLTQGIGSQEFQKVQFDGNLVLEVNASFSDSTFVNGVSNTHTGGTILNNTRYVSNDEGKVPRIDNADGLGQGAVTFANGATLRAISESVTYPWTSLSSTGSGVTNQFFMEYANGLKEASIPITVEQGNTFRLRHLQRGIGANWNDADYSGVRGVFWVSGNDADDATGHSNIAFYPDIENGVLMLSGKELRHGGTGGSGHEWKLGGIATPDSITSYSSGAILRRTGTDGGKVTVEVGSANVNTTWFGEFTYDNNSSKDWNIKKVGTGVWTIGGANTYHGTTEIANGAIRLLKTGEIGDSTAAPKIYFTGGELVFADVPDHNPFSRFVSATGPLKIGVEKGVMVSGEMASGVQAAAGIVKSGEGDLVFTSFHALPTPATVSGGTMFCKVNANFSGSISVADGATLTLYASGKELSVETTDPETSVKTRTGATVSGAGTLKLAVEDDKTTGWRIMDADFSGFTGVLEFPSTNAMTAAYGLTGRWNGWNNHLEQTTLCISSAPETDTRVFDTEKNSITIGALQLLHEHAQFQANAENDALIFGGKAGSESVLNGQFTNKKVALTKNGSNSSLEIGSGFSVLDGSSLTINAGTLIVNADLSGDLNYTLNIASGVMLAGSGKVSAAQFAAAASEGKTTYSVKATDETALTVAGTVNLDNVTLSVDLTDVDPTDTGKTYTLLSATGGFTGSPDQSLVARLNNSITGGKWKLRRVNNGDGTVTLKCAFAKSGFVVVFK